MNNRVLARPSHPYIAEFRGSSHNRAGSTEVAKQVLLCPHAMDFHGNALPSQAGLKLMTFHRHLLVGIPHCDTHIHTGSLVSSPWCRTNYVTRKLSKFKSHSVSQRLLSNILTSSDILITTVDTALRDNATCTLSVLSP